MVKTIEPFSLELAKEIVEGRRHGRIRTLDGKEVSIVDWNYSESHPIGGYKEDSPHIFGWTKDGHFFSNGGENKNNLELELWGIADLIEFDIELAKLAIMAGSGRIVTRCGLKIEVTKFGEDSTDNYPVKGMFAMTGDSAEWSSSGKIHASMPIRDYDLFIEELC